MRPTSATRRLPRRSYLRAAGAATVGIAAGCLGAATAGVSVLSAGSLAATFEEHVGPAFVDETGIALRGEYHGTNAVMRMVTDRAKRPDVVVSADAALLRDRLYGAFTDWDVAFATNSVGIAYDPGTPFGRGLAAGEPWYDLARGADPGDLAIGDPNLDPLGYRALQAFELAERAHDLEGFREEMAALVYEEPDEPQLLAGVESGARAGAVVYRNMAVDRGLPFLEFPDAYNFADPDLRERYATVAFTTDDGYTAVGSPAVYTATVLDGADEPDAGRRLVRYLLEAPGVLVDAGLTVGDHVPRPSGDVPDVIDG